MKPKQFLKILTVSCLLFQAPMALAGWPGGWLEKAGDGLSDVISFGQNGRKRDEERAQSDAKYFKMMAEMQRMQLNQQITYVKQQISVIFEYYCDDFSKLKKINQIQTQTLKTIAAFKGALEYSQKVANYATAFQRINGTVKAQMGQIQNQISSAMNSENGSILELNNAIESLSRYSLQNSQDMDLLLTYVISNLKLNDSSVITNLNTMNLLLSNIHQMLKGLEADVINQMQRSASLNQSNLTQLYILDRTQMPAFTLNDETLSCSFKFKSPNDPYEYVMPYSIASMFDTIFVENQLGLHLSQMSGMVASISNKLQQAKRIIDGLERSMLSISNSSKSLDSIDINKLKSVYIGSINRSYRQFNPNASSTEVQANANRILMHPAFSEPNIKSVLQKFGLYLMNQDDSSLLEDENLFFLSVILETAKVNGVKSYLVFKEMFGDGPKGLNFQAKLYEKLKANSMIGNAQLAEAKISTSILQNARMKKN